jgi:hypothetical protein
MDRDRHTYPECLRLSYVRPASTDQPEGPGVMATCVTAVRCDPSHYRKRLLPPTVNGEPDFVSSTFQ